VSRPPAAPDADPGRVRQAVSRDQLCRDPLQAVFLASEGAGNIIGSDVTIDGPWSPCERTGPHGSGPG
jgi:hypothetical protein